MTSLTAVFTQEGLNNTQDARLNGRYIDIQSFGISEIAGIFDDTRNIDNINLMWCNLPISGTINISPSTQQLNLTIPPNVANPFNVINTSNKDIKELYLFAITQKEVFTVDLANNELIVSQVFYQLIQTGDSLRFFTDLVLPSTTPQNISANKTFYCIKTGTNRIKVALNKANAIASTPIPLTFVTTGTGTQTISKYFLFSIGQFNPEPLVYPVTGALTLRCQLVINNLTIPESINFSYTQATEINDHNIDPNAHPIINEQLDYYGYYVNPLLFQYKGQNLFKSATFHSSVIDEMIVYMKVSDGRFYPAQAISGDFSKVVGIANLSDKTVRFGGIVKLTHSIPINQDIYLSDNSAGNITTNITSIKLGRSLGDNLILWGSSSSGGGSSSVNFLNDLVDVNLSAIQNKQTLVFNSTTSVWENGLLEINSLSDVDTITDTPADKNVLSWNNTLGLWKPKALGLTDLSDFALTTLTNGQTLRYSTSSSKWINTNYGLTIGSNNFIETVTFGSGFTVTSTGGGGVNITYTGTGSSNFTGLSDVPDSYPTDSIGFACFDNTSSNISPNKVKFIDIFNTPIDDPIYQTVEGVTDGLFSKPVALSLVNLTQEPTLVFPVGTGLEKNTFLSLHKIYQAGATNIYDVEGIAWIPPIINVAGTGITGIDTNNNNYASKITFGSGLSGAFNPSTNELTINSTVSGGLSSVQNASSGARPLVYDTGATGGIAKIRAFVNNGQGVTIEMLDNSSNPTSNINDAVTYRLNGTLGANINHTGTLGTISAISANAVIAVGTSLNSLTPKFRGVRGINGIYARLETSGTFENIIIDGSGISSGGGGGGGITIGSNNNASGGNGLQISNASNALFLTGSTNGIYTTNNAYGGFFQNSTNSGIGLGNNEVGITARADNKAQLLLVPKFPFSNSSSQSLSSAPAFGEINVIGASQIVGINQTVGIGNRNNNFGIFIYNGTNWQQLAMGGEFRVNP